MKLKELFKKNHKHVWDKYYPKGQEKITVPNLSIYEYLKQSAKDHMEVNAINYFGKKITFTKFINEIETCAKSLKSIGIREGDVVTICMANTPEAIISFYAINKIGAIANMLHPLSAEEEIKRSLVSTKSVMLIIIDLSYERIKNIIDETNVYKVVVTSASSSMPSLYKLSYNITQGRKIETPKKSEFYMYWKEFISKGCNYNGKTLIKTTKDQAAVILHSGGTTGTPKNILLNNGNVNSIACQGRIVFPDMDESDSILGILPLFHCFGLVVCIHATLTYGVTSILIPKFDAKRYDKLITKYHPTLLAGVPTLYEAMLNNKHFQNIDLSNVKYVISGGDSLSEAKNKEVNEFLKKHNCNHTVLQGYGMTETSGPISIGSFGSDRLGSVGIPLPSNEVKIIDIQTHKEVKSGVIGEICVTGPTVMVGYLNNQKETNDILEKDKKGKIWVHTGDLGYMNEDGVIFYVQRLKRMLIVSGYNVYPSHIEEVILSHKAVASCGVIGIPHPYKVEVPKAFIALKEGYKPSLKLKKEIKDLCKQNLAAYMIPKEFEYRASLPKTIIGKVNYRQLEKE
ncbi:MAG: AMP-binding protein [Bacilli bacterium]|nr:AMP-binding protein [Bacilli bacterium]